MSVEQRNGNGDGVVEDGVQSVAQTNSSAAAETITASRRDVVSVEEGSAESNSNNGDAVEVEEGTDEKEESTERVDVGNEEKPTMPMSKKQMKSLISESKCKQRIAIDLAYEKLMTEKQIIGTITQLSFCYAANRRAANPTQLTFVNFTRATRALFQSNKNRSSWDVIFDERPLCEAYKREEIVYLTADSENVLKTLDPSKIEVHSWKDAFDEVIPKRRLAEEGDKGEGEDRSGGGNEDDLETGNIRETAKEAGEGKSLLEDPEQGDTLKNIETTDTDEMRGSRGKLIQLTMPKGDTLMKLDLDDKCMMKFSEKEEEVEVRAQDLQKVEELGRGAYGVVDKMRHLPANVLMAVKRIHLSLNDESQKRMLIELQASMKSRCCPQMVRFYGAMLREGDVWICMETMDTSLDKFYRMTVDCGRRLPETFVAKCALAIVEGLNFMKEEMNLIHRDVKPSNILLNKQGAVKICDFGISGHLVNSVEVASGSHPYARWKSPFEQLKQVVNEPAPRLPRDLDYSDCFQDFVARCLTKDYDQRVKYPALLAHPFLDQARNDEVFDMGTFVTEILDMSEQERKSVLQRIVV
ncbi:Dual specificity mitogen-activated protein kinase kinase 6 [Toxocara canis]|uniref:mitogen-activated protein kinase kinase n=1 Tax=Toxocara canis TaxID=6265 RepID=A0A0B2UWY4_TOXCA|nr:Dual specificity mitogen-activated protein kinase kinase 6 [Toxocara canis]